jgi:hypothetical protein
MLLHQLLIYCLNYGFEVLYKEVVLLLLVLHKAGMCVVIY